MSDITAARAAKTKLSRTMTKNPRFMGVGITRKGAGYVVIVNLSEPDATVPASVDDVPVEKKIVHAVKARTA